MKNVIIMLILVMATGLATAQNADSIARAQTEALKASIYMKNVEATVQTLMLAFGTVNSADIQMQPFLYRDEDGKYYLRVSNYYFPIEEGQLILSIPEKNRSLINEIDRGKGTVTITKYATENFTRIDGRAMPNEKIELK